MTATRLVTCLLLGTLSGCVEQVTVGAAEVDRGASPPDGGLCNVLVQDCQDPHAHCEPLGPRETTGTCVTGEPRGRPGDTCQDGDPHMGGGCGRGLVCVRDQADHPAGRCFGLCGPDHGCSHGATCTPTATGTAAWGVCSQGDQGPAPPCDGVHQDCAAPEQACVARPGAPNGCVPAGTGAKDQPCQDVSECSKGMQCVAPAGPGQPDTAFSISSEDVRRGGLCKWLCTATESSLCLPSETCGSLVDTDGTLRQDVGVCVPVLPP